MSSLHCTAHTQHSVDFALDALPPASSPQHHNAPSVALRPSNRQLRAWNHRIVHHHRLVRHTMSSEGNVVPPGATVPAAASELPSAAVPATTTQQQQPAPDGQERLTDSRTSSAAKNGSTQIQPQTAAVTATHPQQQQQQRSSSPSQRKQPPQQPAAAAPQPQAPREISLKVRVLALETRGKDLCVRLDAATNHPSFRLSHYSPFLRSFRDLSFFALSLSIHVPTHILSSLPLPSPTFDSSPAESRLLSYSLSKWFARLATEPAHRDHPETRNFVETEYSYQPIAPNPDFTPPLVQRRWKTAMDQAIQAERGMSLDLGAGLGLPSGVLSTPATPSKSSRGGFLGFGKSAGGAGGSGSGSSSAANAPIPGGKGLALSRNVHDEDEDLVAARMEVTRLELQFSDAAKQGIKAVEARSKVTQELHALSNKLHTFAGLEDTRQTSHTMGLPVDLRRLADGIPALDITQQAASNTDSLTLLYQLLYQSANARAAKEALLARNALVEEHHEASKRALLKKREVEHLKARMGVGSAGISRDRIEFAIEDFSEASRYAHALRQTLQGMSSTMHKSLQGHSRNAHADLQQALVEHAKGNVFHLRKNITTLQRLRASLKGEKVDSLDDPGAEEDVGSIRGSTATEADAVGGEATTAATDGQSRSKAEAPAPQSPSARLSAEASRSISPTTTLSAPMSRSSSTAESSRAQGRQQRQGGATEPSSSQQTTSPSRTAPRRSAVRNPWTGSTDTGFSRDYSHQPVPPPTVAFYQQQATAPGTGHHERFATPPLPSPPSARSPSQSLASSGGVGTSEGFFRQAGSRSGQSSPQSQSHHPAQSQSMFLPPPSQSLDANPPPPEESPFASSSSANSAVTSSGFLPRSDAGFGTQSRFGGDSGMRGFGAASEVMSRGGSNGPTSSARTGGGQLNNRPGAGKGRITASDAAKSLAGRF